jgi:uncharacterized membrane protein
MALLPRTHAGNYPFARPGISPLGEKAANPKAQRLTDHSAARLPEQGTGPRWGAPPPCDTLLGL